jgi:hypothetical protein
MHLLSHWWQHEIVHGDKGPLLLGFVAFVVTFLVTRTVTRLIRAGKGPFHNINDGDVHLHHSTPGVLILVAGGFTSLGADGRTPVSAISAGMIGVGASLVLDEFAMIFRLRDDYWTQEGQLSVNIATLAAACVALALVGVSPVGVQGLSPSATRVRGVVFVLLLVHLGLVALTALKGKYGCAVMGFFLSPIAWVAGVRLARPTSPWARWRYRPKRLDHATRRSRDFDRRWAPVRRRWDNLIGGAASMPDPPAS